MKRRTPLLMTAALAAALVADPASAQTGHGPHAHAHAGHEAQTARGKGMLSALGPYGASRDASGTAWVPDSTPMDGVHGRLGPFSTMAHGSVDLVFNEQGGPRGDDKTYSQSMAMLMARSEAGPGVLGLRGMVSLDPLMGKRGYPLLLQSGETANGALLVDRQHPHDFVMELSASYSAPLGDEGAAYVYVGYPGEPALGPPTFMHRFSGMPNPEAPIAHHWLDSTHIAFGVVTLGASHRGLKIEASSFTGQEPDEDRWDFDEVRLDSQSVRLSWNPTPDWALQVSRGWIESPEALEPDTDQTRTTASAIYARQFGPHVLTQTTLAFGRNEKEGGGHDATLDAYVLESAARIHDRHILFARAERTEKDELFAPGDALHDRAFTVGKLSVGYAYEFPVAPNVRFGLGGLASRYDLPSALRGAYGEEPTSTLLFARLRIAQ